MSIRSEKHFETICRAAARDFVMMASTLDRMFWSGTRMRNGERPRESKSRAGSVLPGGFRSCSISGQAFSAMMCHEKGS